MTGALRGVAIRVTIFTACNNELDTTLIAVQRRKGRARDVEPRAARAQRRAERKRARLQQRRDPHASNCERTRRTVAFITTEVSVSLGRCARKGAADRDVPVITPKAPSRTY